MTLVSALLAGISDLPCAAQEVISARAGLVHYVEGAVFLETQPVSTQPGEYPQLGVGQLFHTGAGRAEVLLQPGVFLRLAQDSGVRLTSASITRPEIEFTAGSVIVDAGDLRGSSVTIYAKGTPIELRKSGLYRLDGEPPSFRVYDGKAQVGSGLRAVEIGKGRLFSLDGSGSIREFDRKETDEFAGWSDDRKEYLAKAYLEASQESSDSKPRPGISDASVAGSPQVGGRQRRGMRTSQVSRRSR